jgi:hypothetical protein
MHDNQSRFLFAATQAKRESMRADRATTEPE